MHGFFVNMERATVLGKQITAKIEIRTTNKGRQLKPTDKAKENYIKKDIGEE